MRERRVFEPDAASEAFEDAILSARGRIRRYEQRRPVAELHPVQHPLGRPQQHQRRNAGKQYQTNRQTRILLSACGLKPHGRV